jgi:hypothetical protein
MVNVPLPGDSRLAGGPGAGQSGGMWSTVRSHPFATAAIAIAAIVIDRFVRPIVQLNIERWAESEEADKVLSNWLATHAVTVMDLYAAYIGPYLAPYLLGFATCSILFGVTHWITKRRRPQNSAASIVSTIDRSTRSHSERVAAWKALVDHVDAQYKRGTSLDIQAVLRKDSNYYRLEQCLTPEVRSVIAETSSGIRITPTVVIGSYESIEERAIRMLRQEIARIEHEWDGNATPISDAVDTSSAEEEKARHDLMLFTIDYILPACRAQSDLQDAIIDLIAHNDKTMQWSIRQRIRSEDGITAYGMSASRRVDEEYQRN